ncbi:hypothetical protein HCN51_25855 [Nonomuraea sp. FMUSA5-5]|uniref:Uncharacterized protein n=1 Tax=Nonomuraea composti TaxID=2720023 RepID=A0ABX1B8J5_9ACTN|nr:hypothetical protein [Nonomuraea sp. FMUSA5-5]NJP92842.1 hypothetical protein [Nonomuraea sp. FMUSA5-5]
MSVGRLLSILAAALLPVSVLVPPAQARAAVPFRVTLGGCPGAITEGTLEWAGEEVVKVEGNAAQYTPIPSCTRQSGFHSVAFRAYNGGTQTAQQSFYVPPDRPGLSLELTAPQGTPIDAVTVQICEFRIGPPGSMPPLSILCLAPVRYQAPA